MLFCGAGVLGGSVYDSSNMLCHSLKSRQSREQRISRAYMHQGMRSDIVSTQEALTNRIQNQAHIAATARPGPSGLVVP